MSGQNPWAGSQSQTQLNEEEMVQSLPHSHPFTLSVKHRKMMHEAALRVLVVALGLFLCPRDDPRLRMELDNDATMGLQRHEQRLAREEEELEQQRAPVSETTDTDDATNKYHTESVSEDPTVAKPPDSVGGEESQISAISGPSQSLKSRGDGVTTRQAEQEESDPRSELSKEQKKTVDGAESLSEVHTRNETSENVISDGQEDYFWLIWNIFSVISAIHFLGKCLRKPAVKEDESRTGEVPLPDGEELQRFHSRCVQAASRVKWRDAEFLEGFANHLVEAMQVVCGKDGGMVMEACQMLDLHDIIVPLTPSEPFSFQFLPWDHQESELLPDTQLGGQIKLVENIQNDCPCNSANADDMVCLLHAGKNDGVKRTDICERLCFKKTAFLSKGQVTRWFQGTIKQAWAHISHQYDFELSVRYMDAPGTLLIRFRSGKKLKFTLNPVVKFNTDAHFISTCSPTTLDTCWNLSLTIYEDQLLERLSQHLPDNSCHIQILDIACFLHRRQVALSGSSALKCRHFKTALMHLLLKSRHSAQWGREHMSSRLRDLLYFMERSLENKLLPHVLIGNPLTTKVMSLPPELAQSKPVNLFHPLVVESCIYTNAKRHFQEMLENADMLIHDYVDRA